MFDETYLHYVRNDTDWGRLILMCDVKRPLNPLGAVFNFFYQGGAACASVVPNTPEDRRGLANRIFKGLAPVLARTKALKSTNRPLYRVVKWSGEYPPAIVASGAGHGRGAVARSNSSEGMAWYGWTRDAPCLLSTVGLAESASSRLPHSAPEIKLCKGPPLSKLVAQH